MFCAKCGKYMQDETVYCPNCGNKAGTISASITNQKVKVILNPEEAMSKQELTDSSKSFSGQGQSIGLVLIIISILGSLISMFALGFDAFIPITIGSSVLFVIGIFMRMFCQ